MKEKIQAFYGKVEKYGGWQQVPAKRIHEIFDEVVEPARIEFAVAKPGLLARPVDDDITHVIKLRPLKGASYDICFGASLSYVPYPYLPKVKWHRTLKSASLDLFEEPQVEWWQNAGRKTGDGCPYLAQSSLGEKCFLEELSRAWKEMSSGAMAWFADVRSLQGILQKCAAHLQRRSDGPRHLPGARLVNAFTLGKLNRADEAHSELQLFLQEYQEGPQARTNLESALRQVLAANR